jgi:outer membrane lipoprotein SlyB
MIGRVVNSAYALEVKTLATVLIGCQIGETLTYERLTNAINRDVQNGAFAVLHRARQVVLRDNRIVFDVVRGIGLKRLNGAVKHANAALPPMKSLEVFGNK